MQYVFLANIYSNIVYIYSIGAVALPNRVAHPLSPPLTPLVRTKISLRFTYNNNDIDIDSGSSSGKQLDQQQRHQHHQQHQNVPYRKIFSSSKRIFYHNILNIRHLACTYIHYCHSASFHILLYVDTYTYMNVCFLFFLFAHFFRSPSIYSTYI